MNVLSITQSRMAAKSHKSSTDPEQNKLFTIIFLTSIVLGIIALSSLALTSSKTTKSEAATKDIVCKIPKTIWGNPIVESNDTCELSGLCSKPKVSDTNSPCNDTKPDSYIKSYCCRNSKIISQAANNTCKTEDIKPIRQDGTCGDLNPIYDKNMSQGLFSTTKLIGCCKNDTTLTILPSQTPFNKNTLCGQDSIDCSLMQVKSKDGVMIKLRDSVYCQTNGFLTELNKAFCAIPLNKLNAISGRAATSCKYYQTKGLSYTPLGSRCYFSTPLEQQNEDGTTSCVYNFADAKDKKINQYMQFTDQECHDTQVASNQEQAQK